MKTQIILPLKETEDEGKGIQRTFLLGLVSKKAFVENAMAAFLEITIHKIKKVPSIMNWLSGASLWQWGFLFLPVWFLQETQYDSFVMEAQELLGTETVEADAPILVKGTRGRRVLAGLADFFLVAILSMILYALLGSLVSKSSLSTQVADELSWLSQESQSAGLVEIKDDGSTKSDDDMLYEYAYRLSEYDGTGEANDLFYHYYCVYASSSKAAYSVAQYNADILKIGEADSLFAVTDPAKAAPLKAEIRGYLYAYIRQNDSSAEAQNAYRSLSSFYTATYVMAWAQFATSAPYSTHLVAYTEKATNYYMVLGLVAVDCYVVSAFLLYAIVPLIKHSGMTIGKRVLKLQYLGPDGKNPSTARVFARGGIEILINCMAIPFAPLMLYGFDGFTIPFIVIGSFVARLVVFFIAGALLYAASLVFLFANKEQKSLEGFVTNTCVYTTDDALIRKERARLEEEKRKAEENGSEETRD